jgi:hypothetical protein
MNKINILKIALTLLIIPALTGCYTQVATEETPPEQFIAENENYEYDDYYYEGEEEELDSSYFSEEEYEESDEYVVDNYYYGYPSYRRYYYDYYPSVSFGFGFGFGFASSYYYSYWPYSYGWCGYGGYYPYPYYCYPSYYSYYPGYYYPSYYHGYSSGNYSYYKTRTEYISGIRNRGSGRNYGDPRRDPLTGITGGSFTDGRDPLVKGRDLRVNTDNLADKNKVRTNRHSLTDNDLKGTKITRTDKNLVTDKNRLSNTKNKYTDRDKKIGNADITKNTVTDKSRLKNQTKRTETR